MCAVLGVTMPTDYDLVMEIRRAQATAVRAAVLAERIRISDMVDRLEDEWGHWRAWPREVDGCSRAAGVEHVCGLLRDALDEGP